MIGTCPSCGAKTGGFLRQCASCKQSHTLTLNIDAQKKNPIRPIQEPEDDE